MRTAEVGIVMPPVGLNYYIVARYADRPVTEVFYGIWRQTKSDENLRTHWRVAAKAAFARFHSFAILPPRCLLRPRGRMACSGVYGLLG
jgi:hypothetical protein